MSFTTFKINIFSKFLQKTFSVSMSTCRRLHYVSKVCLRLIRKYTNEIYPNDLPKIERPPPKRSIPDVEDKNEPQLCKNCIHSIQCVCNLNFTKYCHLLCRCDESTSRTIVDQAKTSIETGHVKQFRCNNVSEPEKDAGGEFAIGGMDWQSASATHRYSLR